MFPKIVVPPNHQLLIGFSIINHPFWGTPIFGNTHFWNQCNNRSSVIKWEFETWRNDINFSRNELTFSEEKIRRTKTWFFSSCLTKNFTGFWNSTGNCLHHFSPFQEKLLDVMTLLVGKTYANSPRHGSTLWRCCDFFSGISWDSNSQPLRPQPTKKPTYHVVLSSQHVSF